MTAPDGSRPTTDPDKACAHDHFEVDAVVQTVAESEDSTPDGLIVDLRAWCTQCGERVVWRPTPLTPKKPMLSPDGDVLRIPGHMADRLPDLGLWTPQGEV